VLTDQQWAFLTEEAERLEITVADLLRRIVDDYRAKERRP
jgi:hypothetical protein